jgi:hypothetical protein
MVAIKVEIREMLHRREVGGWAFNGIITKG